MVIDKVLDKQSNYIIEKSIKNEKMMTTNRYLILLKTLNSRYSLTTVVTLFIFGFFLSLCALHIWFLGYWPHDAWVYTPNEFGELSRSGRWLAPSLHRYTHFIPPFTMWLITIFSVLSYFYMFLRSFLKDTYYDSGLSALAIASLFLISPSFAAQSLWPHHLGVAVLVLVIGLLIDPKFKHPVIHIGLVNILIFAILQSVNFVTIILCLPRLSLLINGKLKDIVINMLKKGTIWVASIVIAVLVSKIITLIVLGESSALRSDGFGIELSTFIKDIFSISTKQIGYFYGVAVFYIAGITLGFTLVSIVSIKKRPLFNFNLVCLILILMILILPYSMVFISGYKAFSFRGAMMFGLINIISVMMIYVNVSIERFRLPLILLVVTIPLLYSLQNLNAYSRDTRLFMQALEELKPSSVIHNVVIDSRSNTGHLYSAKFPLPGWTDSARNHPRNPKWQVAFVGMRMKYTLCHELTFNKEDKCQLLKTVNFDICSDIYPTICASYSKENPNVWFVKL